MTTTKLALTSLASTLSLAAGSLAIPEEPTLDDSNAETTKEVSFDDVVGTLKAKSFDDALLALCVAFDMTDVEVLVDTVGGIADQTAEKALVYVEERKSRHLPILALLAHAFLSKTISTKVKERRDGKTVEVIKHTLPSLSAVVALVVDELRARGDSRPSNEIAAEVNAVARSQEFTFTRENIQVLKFKKGRGGPETSAGYKAFRDHMGSHITNYNDALAAAAAAETEESEEQYDEPQTDETVSESEETASAELA